MDEQQINQITEEVRIPFYKKWWNWVRTEGYKKWWFWTATTLTVILVIALFACQDNVQDDLLDYINNDVTEVGQLEDEVIALYEKARNSGNDYTMYQILKNEVIPKSQELISKAEAIEVETEEVKEVHELFLDAINKEKQALTLMLSALENQDYTVMTQANEKLHESRRLKREYKASINKLAEEHNVEITYS